MKSNLSGFGEVVKSKSLFHSLAYSLIISVMTLMVETPHYVPKLIRNIDYDKINAKIKKKKKHRRVR